MNTDHYTTLGVRRDASQDDIKQAWRRLSMKLHPDRVAEGDKAEAEARFKAVKAAYECLPEPEARAHYDATGETPDATGPAACG